MRIAAAGEPRGQPRIVGEHGADADQHRIVRVAQAHHVGARRVAGDPLRLAGDGGDLAVERDRRLERERRAARACAQRQERPVRALALRRAARRRVTAIAARAAGRCDAAAVAGDRILDADHDARDARVAHDRRARRRAAVVVARLEVDVERRAAAPCRRASRARRSRRGRCPGPGARPRRSPCRARSTITQPTIGFGAVRPRCRSASSRQRAM